MLPLSRNTTYTTSSPVKAVDLNDVQDCVIGGKHGAIDIPIHPALGIGIGWTYGTLPNEPGWTRDASPPVDHFLDLPLTIPVGTEIVSVDFEYSCGTIGQLTVDVVRYALRAPGGAHVHTMLTVAGGSNTFAGGSGDTFNVGHVTLAESVYKLRVHSTISGAAFFGAWVRVQRE